jgi:hypothetical protein
LISLSSPIAQAQPELQRLRERAEAAARDAASRATEEAKKKLEAELEKRKAQLNEAKATLPTQLLEEWRRITREAAETLANAAERRVKFLRSHMCFLVGKHTQAATEAAAIPLRFVSEGTPRLEIELPREILDLKLGDQTADLLLSLSVQILEKEGETIVADVLDSKTMQSARKDAKALLKELDLELLCTRVIPIPDAKEIEEAIEKIVVEEAKSILPAALNPGAEAAK